MELGGDAQGDVRHRSELCALTYIFLSAPGTDGDALINWFPATGRIEIPIGADGLRVLDRVDPDGTLVFKALSEPAGKYAFELKTAKRISRNDAEQAADMLDYMPDGVGSSLDGAFLVVSDNLSPSQLKRLMEHIQEFRDQGSHLELIIQRGFSTADAQTLGAKLMNNWVNNWA